MAIITTGNFDWKEESIKTRIETIDEYGFNLEQVDWKEESIKTRIETIDCSLCILRSARLKRRIH